MPFITMAHINDEHFAYELYPPGEGRLFLGFYSARIAKAIHQYVMSY